MKIVLIAAMDRNSVIGRDNKLPWGHFREDMEHFRRVTGNHSVLMGRRTWESLPPKFRPLPGRFNVVLSRNEAWRPDGLYSVPVARSLDDALFLLRALQETVLYVIGGAELYAQMMPLADELVLTIIERDFEGDTHFPEIDSRRWRLAAAETHRAAAPHDFDYHFTTYQLRSAA